MVTVANVLLVLGELSLWIDLGNRLFGSYARTPLGALTRIGLCIIVLMALAAPAVWLWIDLTSHAARIAFYASALVGAAAFVHFLFPYQWGIVRAADPP